MNVLTNILKKLPGLKTSADFDAALADLETEHAAALAAVAELEAQREDLIFSGGDIGKLARDIVEAESKAKTFSIALDGARKRRDEAAKAERMAELEAAAAGNRKRNATLASEQAAFEEAIAKVLKHAENMTVLRAEIRMVNTTLLEGNRADLVVIDPIKQQARDTGKQITDPLAGLVIPGRWPHVRPKTLALANAG